MNQNVEDRRATWVVAGLACLLVCLVAGHFQRSHGKSGAAPALVTTPAALGAGAPDVAESTPSSRAVTTEPVAARPVEPPVEAESITSGRPTTAEQPVTELVEPYPGGHWRLANPEQLDHTLVWFRHILIRHRDVPDELVPLNLPHWRGAPPPPERSREQAFDIARRIADEARTDPGRFVALAADHSEDVATRHLGGAVGGLRASAIRTGVVLDVLQALRPGQASRPVETGYGFHVFLRQSPPEARRVSGARIVLAHEDAPWVGQHLARWPVPRRTKREALELAAELYARLQREPRRFAELVQRYSDHRDATRDGDFGEWSSREATPFPREVEVLRRLQPGEIAPPMDSLFGVEIIQRTADRDRPALASATLRWRFDPTAAPGAANAEAAIVEQAQAVARELSSNPLAFGDYQRSICCGGRSDWVQGKGEAPIELGLARLAPGQVASHPVRIGNEYVLIQRLEPEPIRTPLADVELPAPAHVELETAVAVHGLRLLRKALPALDELPLEPEPRAQLRQLIDTLPPLRGPAAAREYPALQARMRAVLGERYAAYAARLRDAIEAWLLRAPRGERLAVPTLPPDSVASTATPSAAEPIRR